MRALDWATQSPEDVDYQPMHPQSTFGKSLAIWLPKAQQGHRANGGAHLRQRFHMPPAFVPEALSFGIGILADSVKDPSAVRDYAEEVAVQARRALWRFGPVMGVDDRTGTPIVSPNNAVQFVMQMGDRRALLVQVFAGLNLSDREWPEEFMAKIVTDKQLTRRDDSRLIDVPMTAGVLSIDADVELTALVVLAASGHIAAPQRPGQATLSLEDLQWISRTADSDTDLYMFCRDLSRLSDESGRGAALSFGWEGINYWESWRANGKSFFSGGASPIIFIEPHWGEKEWKDSAKLSALEVSLLKLGLSPIAEYDVIEQRGGPEAVYSWHLTGQDSAEDSRRGGNG
jgi:hypothetical protein